MFRLAIGMLILAVSACKTGNRSEVSEAEIVASGEAAETTPVASNDPLRSLACPAGSEPASFSLAGGADLPANWRDGLPAGAPATPLTIEEGQSVRVDTCLDQSDNLIFHRLVWKPTYPGLNALVVDPNVTEPERVVLRIGDIGYSTLRLPPANVKVEGLSEAAFGNTQQLSIVANYSQRFSDEFTRHYTYSLSGIPSAASEFARFLEFYRDNDLPETFVRFYSGELRAGDPFMNPDSACPVGWEEKKHKWLFDERSLEMTLCWMDTGSAWAAFTRNYFAVAARYQDGATVIEPVSRDDLNEFLFLEVGHHNFVDCMRLKLPSETLALSVRRGIFNGCGAGGDPGPENGFSGFRYGVLDGQSWRFGEAKVVSEAPYAPWPFE